MFSEACRKLQDNIRGLTNQQQMKRMFFSNIESATLLIQRSHKGILKMKQPMCEALRYETFLQKIKHICTSYEKTIAIDQYH